MTVAESSATSAAGTPSPTARAVGGRGRFLPDDLLQRLVVGVLVVTGAVQLVSTAAPNRGAAVAFFVPAAILALLSWQPWMVLPGRWGLGVMSSSAAVAGLLVPLAPATTAPALAFVASSAAGEKLARPAAYLVAAVSGAGALAAIWLTQGRPATTMWPWWFAPAVVLPVFVGIARRERMVALRNAREAAGAAARARAADAQAAAYQERNRLSREVHDLLGHALSGIALQLDLADACHQAGYEERANQAVVVARGLVVEGMAETRRAVHALRDVAQPLEEALRRTTGVDGAQLAISGVPVPLDPEVEQAAQRTVQEALTNARRHAPGSMRRVELSYRCGELGICIDNGPSTQAGGVGGKEAGAGVGLVGLRERATVIGGTLSASARPDGGWRVELAVPF